MCLDKLITLPSVSKAERQIHVITQKVVVRCGRGSRSVNCLAQGFLPQYILVFLIRQTNNFQPQVKQCGTGHLVFVSIFTISAAPMKWAKRAGETHPIYTGRKALKVGTSCQSALCLLHSSCFYHCRFSQ